MNDSEQSSSGQLTLPLKIANSEHLPPEAANWFQFTGTDGEVQMLVGYVDALQAHSYARAVSRGESPSPIGPALTHRIVLSDKGFERLREAVQEMNTLREKRRS